MSYRRLLVALAGGVLLPLAAAVFAQVAQQDPEWRPRIWVGGGIGRFSRQPAKWARADDFDGSFNFCRAYFTADRPEAGGSGWNTDFPGADNNFSVRLGELTTVRVRLDKSGQPDYVVVRLTDPLLFRCPILHMEDAGVVRFSDDEVESLRAFLLKGGFVIVDDFWGSKAWDQWEYEIGRVLPPNRYPIVDIPPNHPVMNVLYDVKAIEQVSNIRFWVQTGSTSERGIRQRARQLSRHLRRPWASDGRDVAQYRHPGHMGARRREQGILRPVLAQRLRRRRQHRVVRDDTLRR